MREREGKEKVPRNSRVVDSASGEVRLVRGWGVLMVERVVSPADSD